MKVKLENGQEMDLPESQVMGLIGSLKKATGTRARDLAEFIHEQPWLAEILERNGLEDVQDGKGSPKQGVRGVPCSAGRSIKYTSRYQEIDKNHFDRIDLQLRALRTADFTHLPACPNTIGKDGILRTSDFHQALICDDCRDKLKRERTKARNAVAREAVRKQLGLS